MCGENVGAIMDLYFLGTEKYQTGIMNLFLRYHPDFKHADPQKFYSHYYFNDSNPRKPVAENDMIYASLRIKN